VKRVWQRLALAIIGPLLILGFVTWPPVMPSYREAIAHYQPSEAWLYARDGRLLEERRVSFSSRRLAWVKLADVAPALLNDIISAEDRRFRLHDGVDWLALAGAAKARLLRQHTRGASTLSMQVVGFLTPELAVPGQRSWLDKLRQMRAAWALEAGWSKDQILEAYINLAPYRGETQGIGAAARTLFDTTPAQITPLQSRLVTALLPSPQADAAEIATRACHSDHPECDVLTRGALDMVAREGRLGMGPGLAPHLAAHLLTAPGAKVTSTIDLPTQIVATQALRHQLDRLGGARVRDGAVVVLNNATGDVLAYVGGVGGATTAGAVDGANAYRQAGSTLKPFLYAQAFEKGWLTPASILEDTPVALDTASGLYVPQDYDHVFKGPVSARTALAGSLNVPAVRTLLVVGVDPFRDRLWDLGYHGVTEDGGYYGYSLALGSAEVTLVEQANAYRTIANAGRWSPVRMTADASKVAPRRVMTPQSAWLVSDILSDAAARAATFGPDSALRLPFWAAAKTGTSKGLRDNWCVGFTRDFTVAVWVGNLEGDSMKAVSGTSGAAPVWRDVMMALEARRASGQLVRPDGLVPQVVHFANAIEPPRREWFIDGTAQSISALSPAQSRRPHISNPVSGSIFALDPDIPLSRQRLGVHVTGEVADHRLLLDRRDIGAANTSPLIFPAPGSHLLALIDNHGQLVDQVRFTVR
jgi:penicillin-binding protein 1C